MDRAALKKIIVAVNPDFRILKRNTEDELRDGIMAAEFGDANTPF